MEFDRLARRVMHMTAGAFTAMTWQKELPVERRSRPLSRSQR